LSIVFFNYLVIWEEPESFSTILFINGFLIWSLWGLLELDSKNGQFQPRDPGLAPDWHNLYSPGEKRTFYHNSLTKVSQWEAPGSLPRATAPSGTPDDLVLSYLVHGTGRLLSTLLKLPVTVGLYLASLYATLWILQHNQSLGDWTSGILAASFVALPQPLPLVVLALGSYPGLNTFLDSPVVGGWEALLSLALLGSLVPEIQSLLATLKAAARARLPPSEAPSGASFLTDLFCALCPGLGWRLYPYALQLSFERIVILPSVLNLPVPVPVPRWEVLPDSWVALLYASPLVLPLARVLFAATQGAEAVTPGVVGDLVLSSPSVLVGGLAAVATVLIRGQKEAYARALAKYAEGRPGEEGESMLEDLEESLLEDFDKRLGGG
jgi:hypothetical protein